MRFGTVEIIEDRCQPSLTPKEEKRIVLYTAPEKQDAGGVVICVDEWRQALEEKHLDIVAQLLRLDNTRRSRNILFGCPSRTEGTMAPPPSPTKIGYMSIYDDTRETNAGLDNQDDDVLMLNALTPEKDRDGFVGRQIATPSNGNDRQPSTTIANMAIPMVTEPTQIPRPRQPLTQNNLLNRNVGRSPIQRALSGEPQEVVDRWFEESGIDAGAMATSECNRNLAKRLAYTWKDAFAFKMTDIVATDLITHCIDVEPGSRPFRMRQPRYTEDEIAFASRLHPRMEEAGWIVPGYSKWGAYSQYPPKKSPSDRRFVCNYKPINSCTIKPQWPVHSMEKVFNTVLQANHGVFFQGDAAFGYHGVRVTPGDEHKTAFITPNMQYFMMRMPMGMTGSGHTYCALTDITFGEWPLPTQYNGPRLPSLYGYHPEWKTAFDAYIDDHTGSAASFGSMFDFLHYHYFPRIVFARVFLSAKKTVLFGDRIHALGFEMLRGRIRPSEKHRKRFAEWSKPENHPKNRQDLEQFLYLLPYLKQFIPGRAGRMIELKTAFMERVPIITPTGKESKRMRWLDRPFHWNEDLAGHFKYICNEIQRRTIIAPDRSRQFHIASDTSELATGGVVFQLEDQPLGTHVTDRNMTSVRVLMFLSFKLEDSETRYSTGERETLGVIRCLLEARPWIIESPYPTIVYTDHLNMLSSLSTGGVPVGRVAQWIDEVNLFDLEMVHRPNTTQIIKIADGLSRLTSPTATKVDKDVREQIPHVEKVTACLGRPHVANANTGTMLPYAPRNMRQFLPPGITLDVVHIGKSRWYEGVVRFLLGGNAAIHDYPQPLRRKIKRDAVSFQIDNGVLYREDMGGDRAVCVAEDEVERAMRWAHDNHGHFAIAATIHKLRGNMWWPKRYQSVVEYIQSCAPCAAVSTNMPVHASPIPIVSLRPWDLIGTDYTGQVFPIGIGGVTHIHVVVDYCARFVFAEPTKQPSAATTIASFGKIVNILGYPEEVYSDNASYFVSKDMKAFFERAGTRVIHAPAYSPSSTGLVERMVQLIKRGLKKWSFEKEYQRLDEWPLALPEIVGNINNRSVRGMPFTPAEVMIGWPLRTGTIGNDTQREAMMSLNARTLFNQSGVPEEAIHEARGDHRDGMRQQTADEWVDRAVEALEDRRTQPYRVGDWVWVRVPKTADMKVNQFRRDQYPNDADNTRAAVFKPNWTGPWEICGISSDVSVHIVDATTGQRRKKVHIDHLKLYRRRDDTNKTKLPPQRPPTAIDEDTPIPVEHNRLDLRPPINFLPSLRQ